MELVMPGKGRLPGMASGSVWFFGDPPYFDTGNLTISPGLENLFNWYHL